MWEDYLRNNGLRAATDDCFVQVRLSNEYCMHACTYLRSLRVSEFSYILFFWGGGGGGKESFTPLGEESVTPLAECSLVIDSYLFLKHGTRVFNQRQNRKHVKRISPTSFVWGRGEWRQ